MRLGYEHIHCVLRENSNALSRLSGVSGVMGSYRIKKGIKEFIKEFIKFYGVWGLITLSGNYPIGGRDEWS